MQRPKRIRRVGALSVEQRETIEVMSDDVA